MALYRKKFSYWIKLKILERGFNLCLALNAPSSDVTIEDAEKVNHLVVIRWRLVNWHYKPWNPVGFHHDKLKQVVVLSHDVHDEAVKFWIRVFPDKPITARAAETRMGSGKGTPEYWVAVIKPGRIIYEIKGVEKDIAREAMRIAGYKMPVKTRIISTNEEVNL